MVSNTEFLPKCFVYLNRCKTKVEDWYLQKYCIYSPEVLDAYKVLLMKGNVYCVLSIIVCEHINAINYRIHFFSSQRHAFMSTTDDLFNKPHYQFKVFFHVSPSAVPLSSVPGVPFSSLPTPQSSVMPVMVLAYVGGRPTLLSLTDPLTSSKFPTGKVLLNQHLFVPIYWGLEQAP